MRQVAALMALTLGLVACSDARHDGASTSAAVAEPTVPATTGATATTTTVAEPTTTTAPEQCILVRYEGYAQFEITAPDGTRVLIDVGDPAALSGPPTPNDILLTTHTHWDHFEQAFHRAFPGQQLTTTAGVLDAPGVHIEGIASVHRNDQQPRPHGGSNYVYVVEIAELRIAHFGDIGQEELTAEQMAALGPIDIALSQLANPVSDMDALNRKGFRLMQQLAPRLLLPTHLDDESAALLPTYWPGAAEFGDTITVCPSGLPSTTEFVLLGANADHFAAPLQVPPLTPAGCVCRDD